MTAINACTSETRDAAYMITDSATYYIRGAKAGLVESFEEKTVVMPHLKMALATCGAPEISDLYKEECGRFVSFDDAIRGLAVCSREMADAGYFTRIFDDPDDHANQFRMIIAGWSDERQRPELYTLQSMRADTGAGAAWEPFTLQDGQRILVQPGDVTLADLRKLGFVKDGQVRYRDPAAFLTAVINWQRRNSFFGQGEPDVTPYRGIGGQVMLTRIDAKGVTQRVVQRWDDRIGELIDVSRDAAPERVALELPPGLSRLQRERMEKKARKGTLRAVS